MGKQTVSVDFDDSGSEIENADVESEDVSEEEDPSEEAPLEEDPDEDESQKVNSCEKPEEDPCVPNEDSSYGQELDGMEPNEIDSGGSPSEDERTRERNEESCEEEPCEEEKRNEESREGEPYEEDKQCEEEMRNEESCEEEPYEDHEQCEEEMMEPCEETEDKQCEEDPIEEEPCEEPEEHSEEESDEEAEEELSEDPEEESNEGSPVSQSYHTKDGKYVQSNSTKMRISSDIATESERIFKTSGIHNSPNNVTVAVKPGTTARTGKKRLSKWDVRDEANEPAEEDGNMGTKKRKSRWSRWSNDVPVVKVDLEIPKLHAQLIDINKKLHSGVIDDQPQGERSPSPPPIYNNLGIKINTREARLRSKLMIQKQAIISELIQKNPKFKPPPDYLTSKLYKKIPVPLKEYPGYNFVGLILGPCGNTLKKMEKESGARIKLRGRGSRLDPKFMKGDLHVVIKADNKYSLHAAAAMVEKLLIPVDDEHNEHKLSQLRELAKIRGNLKENNIITSKKLDTCNICGDTSHLASSCPLVTPTPGANSNGQKMNFAEMGSGLSPFNAQPLLSVLTIPSMNNSTSHGQKVNFAEMGSGLSPVNAQPPLSVCTIPSMNNSTLHASRPKKMIDDANLFVGCLPQFVDDNALIELFAPFGPLSKVNVVRDRSTNISKGYGFVLFADHISAAKAVAQMNGFKIDGKVLSVRVSGSLPPPHINQLPNYPGTSVIAQNNPHPMCWPGPPESRLPETVASLSNNCSYTVHHNSFSGQYLGSLGPSFQTPKPNSLFPGNFATSNELAQFPGYLKSLNSPPQLHHPSMPSNSVPSSQIHFSRNFGFYQMPPT